MTTANQDERAQRVAATVREMRAHVRPMERRYGYTSGEMWNSWQDGDEPEDEAGQEEVFDWMMHWRVLRDMLTNPAYEILASEEYAALTGTGTTNSSTTARWPTSAMKES